MGASAKALQDAHWEYYQSGLERILAEESPPALGARTTVAAVAVNPNASTKPRPVRSTKGPAAGTAIARARDKFAESGTFKLGTNRAFIYDLLSRDGGATLDECRHACLNPHRTSSIVTDLYDVAVITQRKLVKGMHDGAERYWLEK
jgi:hypothetical protein